MKYEQFNRAPMGIEKGSMSIIHEEMKNPHKFTKNQLAIAKRVIHTTADFEYEDIIAFKNNPVESFLEGMKAGLPIITDTNMIRAGINKTALGRYGSELYCFVGDERVVQRAKETGVTRSRLGIDHVAKTFNEALFVFGNAPTALARTMELCELGQLKAKAIIGVPVGFVGAVESKYLLNETSIPHITTLSRKGGSNVAAAIVNAIMYMEMDR